MIRASDTASRIRFVTKPADGTMTPMGVDAASRTCPHCGGELLAKALQCRHCRRWMPEAFEPATGVSVQVGAMPVESVYSNGQPVLHLVVLSLLTLGIYEVYWFWRNWSQLRDWLGHDISPGWRAFGLLLPVVNVVLVYDQLRLVRESALARGVAVAYSSGLTTAAFFAVALAGNLTLVWVFSLLNVLPLVPVQETLNRLWEREQPGAPIRARFVPREVAAIVGGAIVTGLALLETSGFLPAW